MKKEGGRIIEQLLAYAPSRLVPALIGFVSILVFTRLLSPEEYGRYVIVYTGAMFISGVGFSWIFQSVLRYYEQWRELGKIGDFFVTIHSLTVRLAITTILAGIIFEFIVLTWLGNSSWFALIITGGLLASVRGTYMIVLKLTQAQSHPIRYSLYAVIYELGGFLLGVLLVGILGHGAWIIIGMVLAGILVFIVERTRQKKFLFDTQQHFSRQLMRKMVSYGLPLASVGASTWLLAFADRFIIEIFRGEREVAIYASVYMLTTQSLGIFFRILMLSAYPSIIGIWEKEGPHAACQITGRYLGLFCMASVPIVATVVQFRQPIISLALPGPYLAGIELVPWIMLGAASQGLSEYFGIPLLLKEKTKQLFYIIGLASIFNISLNVLLIPQFGLLGAAYATCVAYAVYALILLWFSRDGWEWHFPLRYVRSNIFALMIMWIAWQLPSGMDEIHQNFTLVFHIVLGLMGYAVGFLLVNVRSFA